MTNKDKLRKILNDRLQELTELSFGCEVWRDMIWPWIHIYEYDDLIYYIDDNQFDVSKIQCFSKHTSKYCDYKILWHQPQYHHLLQVLGEWYFLDGKWWLHKMNTDGTFKSDLPIVFLDLKIPLPDQDPEVIEKLISLIEDNG